MTNHGLTREDPYFWLHEKDNPEVLAYLVANNEHVRATLAHLEPLRSTLYAEFISRIEQNDLSVPARSGPFWYYQRTVEGLDYPIACRRPAGPIGEAPPNLDDDSAAEQIVFDENLAAQGHDYFAVGTLSVSPDHEWLAVGSESRGDQRYTLTFRRLRDGYEAQEAIEDTSYGLAWANDNATVFYTKTDAALRPFQVWRHQVDGDPSTDVCVFEEADARFSLSVGSTKDRRAIVIHSGSKTTAEVWLLDPNAPLENPTCVAPRTEGVDYAVEHHHGTDGVDRLLILANDDGPDFSLSVQERSGGPRTTLIPHRPGTRIDGVDAFSTFLVIDERINAERRLRICPFSGHDGASAFAMSHLVPTTTSPATTWEGENPEFTQRHLRYGETSLATPSVIAELDLDTGTTVVRKRQQVKGDFDATRYQTERHVATAADGTEIPISLVYRSDLAAETPGPRPCLLYGYGSYEACEDPAFSSLRLSLLDRGFTFAIAHVRGGGEMGRAWYDQGKLANKMNTFTDFLACAHALIDTGWTTASQLVARGGSAGGLLMGAVANMEPTLFAGIVAEVPFVDCLTTMLDASLPLTVGEYEEWGNPSDDPAAFATMLGYSPYDNVVATNADGTPRRYPPMYVTCGLNDPLVSYFEPAKWVAKLRAVNPENVVYFHSELGAGHGGPSGRYEIWADEAQVFAFICACVGIGSSTLNP